MNYTRRSLLGRAGVGVSALFFPSYATGKILNKTESKVSPHIEYQEGMDYRDEIEYKHYYDNDNSCSTVDRWDIQILNKQYDPLKWGGFFEWNQARIRDQYNHIPLLVKNKQLTFKFHRRQGSIVTVYTGKGIISSSKWRTVRKVYRFNFTGAGLLYLNSYDTTERK